MYCLINTHIPQILQNIQNKDPGHVYDYDYLIQNLQQATTPQYQRKYRNYWRLNVARLLPSYYHQYFQQLQSGLSGSPPQMQALVTQLYQIPTHANGRQTLQFSFCSKLCHMLDPHLPIYDAMIAAFYFYIEPNPKTPCQQRIAHHMTFYNFLIKEYNRVLTAGLLTTAIQQFRQHFSPQHFTDEKVIDSLIWAFVTLARQGGVINGTIVYR